MKYKKIVMVGPPGGGKGTQSKLISTKYGIQHISSGDVLREEIKKKSDVGIAIQTMTGVGNLVSDEVINKFILGKICKMDNYILDGYPRTVSQAEMLQGKVDVVILIDVDEDTCVKRVFSRNDGREEDNEETCRKRYKIYMEHTAQIIWFYSERGLLRTIDGSGSSEDVFARILEVFDDAA